jgi:hypothetical protein
MELTQAQIDFRNKLEELADRAGSALVLPDNSQMDAEAFLKEIDKSEVESILNELGVEKKSEEYEDGVPYTGDEIHFTDGTIWSVLLFSDLYPLLTMEENTVIFVPMSFEQGKEQGYVKDYYFSNDVKGVLKDALKGGAKIVRGVGVKK